VVRRRPGVQLPAGDRLLVSLLATATSGAGPRERSTLACLSDGALVEWRRFDRAYACSTDRHGRLLARDTGSREVARRDLGLDAAGGVFLDQDLGRYDCSTHHVRIDGGDALYFLQGTPSTGHQGKRLCRVDAAGAIHDGPTWDDRGAFLMDGCATRGLDDTIVRAYRDYHPDPRVCERAIEAWALSGAGARWRLAVDADVTALITMADRQVVVFALTSGRLGAIGARSGEPGPPARRRRRADLPRRSRCGAPLIIGRSTAGFALGAGEPVTGAAPPMTAVHRRRDGRR
jgi:hypothetical protein